MKLFRKRETVALVFTPGPETPVFDTLEFETPLPDWSDYLGDLVEVAA